MSLTQTILNKVFKVDSSQFKVVSTGDIPLWAKVKIAFFALSDILVRDSYTITIDEDLDSVDIHPLNCIKSEITHLWDILNGKALVILGGGKSLFK